MVLMLGRPPALLLPLLRPTTPDEAIKVGAGTEKEIGGGRRATPAAREAAEGFGRADAAAAVPAEDAADSWRPGATAVLLRLEVVEKRVCTSTVVSAEGGEGRPAAAAAAPLPWLKTTVPEAAVVVALLARP